MNTPETCLETFFSALAEHDLVRARSCVLEAKPDSQVDQLLSRFPSVQPTSIQVQQAGDSARASFVMRGGEPWHLNLTRSGHAWLLCLGRPVDEMIASGIYDQDRSFDPLIAWMVHPERFDELMAASRDDADAKVCWNNVRILTHMLWNGVVAGGLAVNEENWRDVIRERLPKHPNQDHDWFTCPVTGASYSINLADWNLAAKSLRDCPIVYEGEGRQLSFVHHGRAQVGFSSGKARLVLPDEAIDWD